MPATNLKRLRLCRFPLLLGFVVCGFLLFRVPLRAFTSDSPAAAKSASVAKVSPPKENLADSPAAAAIDAAPDAESPTVGQTADAVVVPQQEQSPAVEAESPAPVEAIASLDEELQPHARLAEGLYRAMPNVLGLLSQARPSRESQTSATVATQEQQPVAAAEAEVNPPLPIEQTEALPAEVNDKLVLLNPKRSGGAIHFLVGEQVHRLEAGESLELTAEKATRVRFHRGESFGNADHRLSTAGTFEFLPTEEGWQLLPVQP